jgi:hypothetical protein
VNARDSADARLDASHVAKIQNEPRDEDGFDAERPIKR